jgi:MFS family permease
MGTMKFFALKTRQPHLGRLWQHSDFLKLWAGESCSLFGSQVTTVAIPLTAVLLLSATPAQMGLVNAAGFVPYLVLSVFAGMWIDRMRRRPIMIIANVGQAVLIMLIPLLAALNRLSIEYLIAITLLVGILKVFFHLAYQTFLPTLVERDQLVEANSKLSASKSMAEVGGPGLAGMLVELVTAPFALLLDALSFVASAITIWRIGQPEPLPSGSARQRPMNEELSAGFRVISNNRYLIAFAGEAAMYNLFWFIMQTVFLLYVIRELGVSPLMVGFLLMAGSLGAFIGSLLTEQWARKFGLGRTIVGASVLGAVTALLIPLAQQQSGVAVGILVVGLFLRGLGVSGCNVHVHSLTQVLIPDELRGRVNASYLLLTYGGIAVGSLLGGFLGASIGLWWTLLIGAIGVSCSCLWLLLSPVRRLSRLADLTNSPATSPELSA